MANVSVEPSWRQRIDEAVVRWAWAWAWVWAGAAWWITSM